jgi:tellurite resistance protein TerC
MIPWLVFGILVLAMLGVDLFCHRNDKVISMRAALGWSILWIVLALLFNVYVYFSRGSQDALNFFTGYLIEKSLSIDNLFVFLLIFQTFRTPIYALHKVLFWGVFGAVVMRALFIWLGIALIEQFHWIIYFFGLLLVVSGIKLWFEKDKEIDTEKNLVLRVFKRYFSVTKEYVGTRFFVKQQGVWLATPLFVVLLMIETTDVIFAIDSIPAILAITYDPFVVYTSNIFAILGLRSLYFVLQSAMGLFEYLHYGLAILLVFVGVKMLISGIFVIPTVYALGFIVVTLGTSVALSLRRS